MVKLPGLENLGGRKSHVGSNPTLAARANQLINQLTNPLSEAYLFPGIFREKKVAARSRLEGETSSSTIYFFSVFCILSLSFLLITNSSLPGKTTISKIKRSLPTLKLLSGLSKHLLLSF